MALRVLTQINYSAGENVEADSGLRFIEGVLKALARQAPNLHFYVLIPVDGADLWHEALDHPRITPVELELAPRLHGGDFRFEPRELYTQFDFRRFDIDVLFANQPETTVPMLQFLNRQTFHNIRAVSYLHWLDRRRPSTPKEGLQDPSLLAAVSGLLVSTSSACNSEFGKKKILDEAARWFRDDLVNELEKRLVVLPPGFESAELLKHRAESATGVVKILINHRVLRYTGVRDVVTRDLPRLWQMRKDFHVTLTNPSKVRLPREITDVPWMTVETLNREEYLRGLWTHDLVIAPHRATHWSISTLEAMAAECVPLMNQESFFPEMMAPVLQRVSVNEREAISKRWFYYRGNFLPRLCQLMDDLEVEKKRARSIAQRVRSVYTWDNQVPVWLELFRQADDQIPAVSEYTPTMRRIVDALQSNSPMHKSEILRMMRWAPKQRALSWTSYRKTLRRLSHDDPDRSEAVFHWNGSR